MNDIPVVISVGGSLIAPKAIDTDFLDKFKNFMVEKTGQGRRFIIVSGGGDTAREYQKAARVVGKPSEEDLDWLGIHSTRLNANLVKVILGDLVEPTIVMGKETEINFTRPILISGGHYPGRSTDYIAVALAQKFNSHKIVNLTNIDRVFDKDPAVHPDAKPLDKVTWTDFRQLIPDKWSPGIHTPFDPEAAKLAEAGGMEVVVINGTDLSRLDSYLSDKDFIGTLIS